MNKKQLVEFRGEVEKVIAERRGLGDFDANSKYMIFLLGNMRSLINHAIDTYPKGQIQAKRDPDAKTRPEKGRRS